MFTLLKEGWRMLQRRIAFKDFIKHDGSAKEICEKVVEDCWNGHYFQVSTGHFRQFYVRDFAYCAKALMYLGHKERVQKTLSYALEIFQKQGKITTTITPDDKAIDVFRYTPESLALLLHALKVAKADKLTEEYKGLLEKEAEKAFKKAFDPDLGLVKKNIYFSSMKDNALRSSSTYINIMLAMLKKLLYEYKLKNPFSNYNIKEHIKNSLWNGTYFLDDLSGKTYVAADANIIPFWSEIFTDMAMLKSALRSIQQETLDHPFPIKYTSDHHEARMLPLFNRVVPNYEGNAVWTFLGPLYIGEVLKIDRARAKDYLGQYTAIIEKYGNYLEVFNPDASPFKTLLYVSDESMLWASMYLALI